MLVPLAALPLHRIQPLWIIGVARRLTLGLNPRTETNGVSLLAELLHGTMLDQCRDETAHRPVLQPMTLDVNDMSNMRSRERREPRCETIDDIKSLVLSKPGHLNTLE